MFNTRGGCCISSGEREHALTAKFYTFTWPRLRDQLQSRQGPGALVFVLVFIQAIVELKKHMMVLMHITKRKENTVQNTASNKRLTTNEVCDQTHCCFFLIHVKSRSLRTVLRNKNFCSSNEKRTFSICKHACAKT